MKGHKAAKHDEFKCSNKQCNATFISRSKLEHHIQSIDESHDNNEFSCDKCTKSFRVKTHYMSIEDTIVTYGSHVMNVEMNIRHE